MNQILINIYARVLMFSGAVRHALRDMTEDERGSMAERLFKFIFITMLFVTVFLLVWHLWLEQEWKNWLRDIFSYSEFITDMPE